MPNDIKTNVIIETQTKGLDQAKQKSNRFNQEITKGIKDQSMAFKEAEKSSVSMNKRLEDLNKSQAKIIEKMISMKDKGSDAYKTLEGNLKAISKEASLAERHVRLLDRAFKEQRDTARQAQQDAQQRRGAFTQGLAQGGIGMPAGFIQRGPGMGRQMAGMAVGYGLSGGMRGAGLGAGAAFTGLGGVQQAMAGIPVIGGFMAGQLGAVAADAQTALQYQQQLLSAMPFLGGPSSIGGAMSNREAMVSYAAKVNRRKGRAKEAQDLMSSIARPNQTIQEAKAETKALLGVDNAMANMYGGGYSAPAMNAELAKIKAVREKKSLSQAVDETFASVDETTQALAQQSPNMTAKEKARLGKLSAAFRASNPANVGDIGSLGMELRGLSKQDTLQEVSQLLQAGGGRLGEARGMLPTAMSARTLFGVGYETSGAFLSAGRRGGMVGAQGRGSDALRSAIQDGLSLGLEGSELTTYMQQMASDIQNFAQTGIPLNKDSLSAMATEFSSAGVTGTRAVNMARGMQNYMQGMGKRGVTGGADMMMMQMLGGYKPGTGAEGYRQALMNLEEMQLQIQQKGIQGIQSESPIGKMLSGYMNRIGGSSANRKDALRALFNKKFGGMSVRESEYLGTKLLGGTPDEGQLKAIQDEEQRRTRGGRDAAIAGTEASFRAAAGGAITLAAPNMRTQAAIQNKQLQVGQQMLGVVQKLELAAKTTNSAFATLTAGPLSDASNAFVNLTQKVENLAGLIEDKGWSSAWGVVTGTAQ